MRDAFMLGLDTAGNTLWSRVAGSADDDNGGKAVGIDAGGRVWFAGNFTGSANFFGTTLPSLGLADFYIAAMDTGGNPIFVRQFGGTGYDITQAMALSPAGSLAITGVFQSSMAIGGITLTSAGAEDVFLAYFQ